ncbi:MAG: hypothetical protein IT336_10720, partial [Thermomicrobiales bacterium]|nr:hypothetical protein [Thermomicrobiales bacterium]
MSSILSTAGLARLSARHPWRVLALWVVLLVMAAISAPSLGDALTTEANFTNRPESLRGDELLEERLRGERPMTETIVVHSDELTVDDLAYREHVDGLMAMLVGMPDVVDSWVNYFWSGGDGLV